MTLDRSISQPAESPNSIRWVPIIVGMLLGIIAMDLVVRRPLMKELALTRTQIITVEREVEKLVGVRDQVWETNNLLTGLKAQQRQLSDAQRSVQEMQQLCKELTAETEKLPASFSSLDQLVSLRVAVLRGAEEAEKAKQQADHLVALQTQVVSSGEHTQHANAAISALVRVRDAARLEMSDIEAALNAVKKLGDLKQRTLTESKDTEIAQENLSGLVAIKSGLAEQREVEAAKQNLEDLIGLQDKLNQQSKQVASAVANLEVMTDLSDELTQQVDSINAMRKSLLDIILMESTVQRVTRILEPLTQLGNLRRLGDEDLRRAAQAVIDARNQRLAQNSDETSDAFIRSLSAPKKVTERPAHSDRNNSKKTLKIDNIKFFTDEVPADILVPTPMADDVDAVLDGLSK